MHIRLLLTASALHLVSPLPAHAATAVVATTGWLLLRAAFQWVRATPAPLDRITDAARRQIQGLRRAARLKAAMP